ncbi:CvpA family protein [Haliovirga abyssi]|uniref:CvpA family protein n=1 Tax=Haliovirga abyssi TaxID=2996794 RepID=A0AAU9DQL5_9FUSO|nr:CvpA family protein [Haliovirga abyssi]BDU50773.1 hypothetical protein HLVA_13420 [Haliovirga abyssi]
MYIDSIIIAIIALSMIIGIFKGFILEFFSLFGGLISILIAKRISGNIYLIVFGSKHIKNNTNYLIVYVLTILVSYIIMYMIILLLKKFFHTILLGWLDRVLGGLAGFLKGSFIAIVILLVMAAISNFNDQFHKELYKSYSGKAISKISPKLVSLMPKNLEEEVKKFNTNINIEEIINKSVKKNVKFKDLKNIDTKKILKNSKNEKEINDILQKALKGEVK